MKGPRVLLTSICVLLMLLSGRALCNGGASHSSEEIQITPQTVIVGGHGTNYITVHTEIPHSLAVEGTATLEGKPAEFTFADDMGMLVAKFPRAEIEDAVADVFVKTGVRPVGHALDPAMFHRVPMDVIHMALEVILVPNSVLPIAALPDPSFTPFRTAE